MGAEVDTPKLYIHGLFSQGKGHKARCMLEYFFRTNDGERVSAKVWSTRWGVSRTTAWTWCKEFETAYEMNYDFFNGGTGAV